jgi:hypothetical protein
MTDPPGYTPIDYTSPTEADYQINFLPHVDELISTTIKPMLVKTHQLTVPSLRFSLTTNCCLVCQSWFDHILNADNSIVPSRIFDSQLALAEFYPTGFKTNWKYQHTSSHPQTVKFLGPNLTYAPCYSEKLIFYHCRIEIYSRTSATSRCPALGPDLTDELPSAHTRRPTTRSIRLQFTSMPLTEARTLRNTRTPVLEFIATDNPSSTDEHVIASISQL